MFFGRFRMFLSGAAWNWGLDRIRLDDRCVSNAKIWDCMKVFGFIALSCLDFNMHRDCAVPIDNLFCFTMNNTNGGMQWLQNHMTFLMLDHLQLVWNSCYGKFHLHHFSLLLSTAENRPAQLISSLISPMPFASNDCPQSWRGHRSIWHVNLWRENKIMYLYYYLIVLRALVIK